MPAALCPTLDAISRNAYNFGIKTIVSEKGQITIPKPLRVRLGIRKGQVLDVREQTGSLVLTKRRSHDAFAKYFGALHLGASTDEVMDILRGPDRPQ